MAQLTFGPFSLDTGASRLLREGVEIRLRPRVFHTLRVLAQRPGEFIGYAGMIAEAWEGTHVSPHTVDVTVSEVRKQLGEYGQWIVHRPKFGYALVVPRADELVRQGWHYWSQRTRRGCERAIECFTKAIAESPSDFRAFEGMSASYLTLGIFGMRAPLDVYPLFLEAHEQAVALIGLRPELRCNRAFGLCVFERDYTTAEGELRRSIEEKPSLATAYVRLGLLYGARARFDEALQVLARGKQTDLLLPTLAAAEILVRCWQRDFATAVTLGRTGVELHPYLQVAHVNYGHALRFNGQLEEALEQYHVASVMSPDLPWLRALEGACQARLGRHRDARAILQGLENLRRTEYVDAYYMAVLRTALEQPDEAMAELARGEAENSAWLYARDVDPQLDPIRDRLRA
jgi:DNA-binding winged helix-turn-helix (wHTH) protein/Flp pilus assembly protein TadD